MALAVNQQRMFNETLPEMICEINSKGMITYANSSAQKEMGYDEADIAAGLHFVSVVEQSFKQDVLQIFDSLLTSTDSYVSQNLQLQKKNGSVIQITLQSTPFFFPSGEKGLRVVVFDNLLWKKNEKILKQYTERLELALLATNAGLWDWNMVSNKLVLNEQWHNMREYRQVS